MATSRPSSGLQRWAHQTSPRRSSSIFIVGAEQSLDIAVQEIDSEPIAQAILDARFRHVAVRIFLEHAYLQTKLTKAKIDELAADPAKALAAQWEEDRPAPASRTNRDIMAAFLRSDIEVHPLVYTATESSARALIASIGKGRTTRN